jgi:hypothetical protein
MTQSELLKLAIEKAGSKQKLSELLGLKVQRIYEWEQGSEIRFNKMVDVLKIVGIGLKTYSLIEVVNVDFSEMNKPKRKLNVPTMRNPPPPPKRKIEKKIFFASKPFENAETIVKSMQKCECHLDSNGLLRRCKIKCTKPKSEHKF